MNWTETYYQELSRKVASKFGIDECTPTKEQHTALMIAGLTGSRHKPKWLHDSWHEIMELCVKYGVTATHLEDGWNLGNVKCAGYIQGAVIQEMKSLVYYSDHNGDHSLAERIARLLALCEAEV